MISGAYSFQIILDVIAGKLGTEIGRIHTVLSSVANGFYTPFISQVLVPDGDCRPQRSPGITGCRLDPDLLEWAFAKEPSVADTVQRYASCETKVFLAGFFVYVKSHA